MTLVIRLDNAPSGLLERERRLERGRLTIGRTAESDWVLPDPQRYLSRQHCLLEGGDDQFWITDTSSNGVFLDAGATPLGRGHRAPLRDGMRIALGDYVLRVRIEAAAAPRAEIAAGSSLFDEPDDAQPKAPPPVEPTAPAAGGLFDSSWVGDTPFRSAAHPVREVETGPGTPPDHLSPEFEAFELRPLPKTPRPPVEVVEPPPASKPTPPADPAPAGPAWAGSDRRLLEAFLAGVGVAPEEVPDVDPEAQLKAVGEAFQALTAGLTQLLATRTLVKREAGVERTTVGATGNNPLKLSANDHEAVLALLRHRGPGYLEPREAIRAAFGDLKSHELGLFEGMQTALRTLLRRFDPQVLEREFEDASLFARLTAGGRKALYWKLYNRRYAEVVETARSRFLGEVGVDFARAYQEKARSL